MAQDVKRLLLVDDTKIDRMVLKGILSSESEFEVLEASSGNEALEYIMTRKDQMDAILLDLAMPNIDGFDVLRFMQEKGVDDIPVFVITAEPTMDNVKKALQYHVDDFIGKPFDRDDVLWRLRSRLGVMPDAEVTKEDMVQTKKYISDLEMFYQSYLCNFGKDDKHYRIMVDIMRILLNAYTKTARAPKLSADSIELISKAAYFCDIGEMLIPDKKMQFMTGHTDSQVSPEAHTIFGSNLIRLNHAPSCHFFVEVCSSMCLHHHERFDGKGYPNRILGKNNSTYNQLCAVVDEFDDKRSKFYGDSAKPVKFVIKRLVNDDAGLVSKEVYDLLEDCEPLIVNYFMKQGT